MLNIVDDITLECLRAVLKTSISGKRTVRVLVDFAKPTTAEAATFGRDLAQLRP